MIAAMSPFVPLVSAFFFLLVLSPVSLEQRQQFAWKPQGRFGKRFDRPLAIEGTSSNPSRIAENKRNLATANGGVVFADRPIIHVDDITCMKTMLDGYYKCIRVNNAVEKHLSEENMFKMMTTDDSKHKQKIF